MRRAFIWLLLAPVVALQMGNRWLVYVTWKVNQEYIARELCENRDAPELECEGRCCLKKEMQKTEEQERKGQRLALPELAPAILQEALAVSVASLTGCASADGQAYPRFVGGRLSRYAAHVWQPPEV